MVLKEFVYISVSHNQMRRLVMCKVRDLIDDSF